MPYKIPTAHHQQQDDQQRGHKHQQGQPDVVPHGGARAGGLRAARQWARAGGRRVRGSGDARRAPGAAKLPGSMGDGRPLGSAPRGRGADEQPAGAAARPARPSFSRGAEGGRRRVATLSSLGGAGDAAPRGPGSGRGRHHGGCHTPGKGEKMSRGTRGSRTAPVATGARTSGGRQTLTSPGGRRRCFSPGPPPPAATQH